MGQWQIVFFIAAGIYAFCASFYNVFASGERQPWDNPMNDDQAANNLNDANNTNNHVVETRQ